MYKQPTPFFGFNQAINPHIDLDSGEVFYPNDEELEFENRDIEKNVNRMKSLYEGGALPYTPPASNASEEDIVMGLSKQLFGIDADDDSRSLHVTFDADAYDKSQRHTKGRSNFVRMMHDKLNDPVEPSFLIPRWNSEMGEWEAEESIPIDEGFTDYEYARQRMLDNVREGLAAIPRRLSPDTHYSAMTNEPLEEGESPWFNRYGNPNNYDASRELHDAGAMYGEYMSMSSRRTVPTVPVLENGEVKYLKGDAKSLSSYANRAKKEGLDVKYIKALQTRGVNIDGEIKAVNLPFQVIPGDDDERINGILQKGEKTGGIIDLEDAEYLGYTREDIDDYAKKKNALGKRRAHEFLTNIQRKGPIGIGEHFGLSKTYSGTSLTEENKDSSAIGQIANFIGAKLSPPQSYLAESGTALARLYGADEEGKQKLYEKGGLNWWEQLQAGVFTDDIDTQYMMLNERAKSDAKIDLELGLRDTTFLAGAAMALVDSSRLMTEMAAVNLAMPGSGLVHGIGATALYSGVNSYKRYLNNIANLYEYDPETDELNLSRKGMGKAEGLVKSVLGGAVEYLGEMFTVQALGAIAKKGAKMLGASTTIKPSHVMRIADDVAMSSGDNILVNTLRKVFPNPSPNVLAKIKAVTGRDMSVAGLIHESWTEEAIPGAISAFFNLDNQSQNDGGLSDAWTAIVEATKMAPQLAVSVAVHGAGAGMLSRGMRGFLNTGASRRDIIESLVSFGDSRADLEKMDKKSLNDRFYERMSNIGARNLYRDTDVFGQGIREMTDEELDDELYALGLDQKTIDGLSREQKEQQALKSMAQSGYTVFMDDAIQNINNAIYKSVVAGQDHESVLRALNVDILNTGSWIQNKLSFKEEDELLVQQIVLLRSLAGSRLYGKNIFGLFCRSQANSLEEQLSDNARVMLRRFESSYSDNVADFANTNEESRAASTFAFDVGNVRPLQAGQTDTYTDNDSGIELQVIQSEDGYNYRVVPAAKSGNSEFDMALQQLGIDPVPMRLPYGEKTFFKTIEEAVDFANRLSSWHNTMLVRIANKAELTRRAFEHFRGDGANLVVLTNASAMPENVGKELFNEALGHTVSESSPNGNILHAIRLMYNADGWTAPDGTVYVFLDNLEDVYQIELLARHEATHQGLLDAFALDPELRNNAMLELAKSGKLPKEFFDVDLNNALSVEERLADLSEVMYTTPGLWESIKQAFTKASFNNSEFKQAISDANIHKILFNAYNARLMRQPNAQAQEEVPQEEAVGEETPKAKPTVGAEGTTFNPTNSKMDSKRKENIPAVPIEEEVESKPTKEAAPKKPTQKKAKKKENPTKDAESSAVKFTKKTSATAPEKVDAKAEAKQEAEPKAEQSKEHPELTRMRTLLRDAIANGDYGSRKKFIELEKELQKIREVLIKDKISGKWTDSSPTIDPNDNSPYVSSRIYYSNGQSATLDAYDRIFDEEVGAKPIVSEAKEYKSENDIPGGPRKNKVHIYYDDKYNEVVFTGTGVNFDEIKELIEVISNPAKGTIVRTEKGFRIKKADQVIPHGTAIDLAHTAFSGEKDFDTQVEAFTMYSDGTRVRTFVVQEPVVEGKAETEGKTEAQAEQPKAEAKAETKVEQPKEHPAITKTRELVHNAIASGDYGKRKKYIELRKQLDELHDVLLEDEDSDEWTDTKSVPYWFTDTKSPMASMGTISTGRENLLDAYERVIQEETDAKPSTSVIKEYTERKDIPHGPYKNKVDIFYDEEKNTITIDGKGANLEEIKELIEVAYRPPEGSIVLTTGLEEVGFPSVLRIKDADQVIPYGTAVDLAWTIFSDDADFDTRVRATTKPRDEEASSIYVVQEPATDGEPKTEPKTEPKAETQAEATEEQGEPEVSNYGGNSISNNTFYSDELKSLNGMDDITTPESQEEILSLMPYAEAVLARAKNLERASGGVRTPESNRLRDDFIIYAETVQDLPDSPEKERVWNELNDIASGKKLQRFIAEHGGTPPMTKTEKPKVEKPKVEKPKTKAEKPKAETPNVEKPKVEKPKAQPKPKAEAPKAEAEKPAPTPKPTPEPKSTPKAEAPIFETSATATDDFLSALDKIMDLADSLNIGNDTSSTEGRMRIRTKPAPKKTFKAYKLMRLNEDGTLSWLFIDKAQRVAMNTWNDAESPDLSTFENLERGYTYLVHDDGKVEKMRHSKKPTKTEILKATEIGARYFYVDSYADGSLSVHNWGLNTGNNVASYALRPGIHATNAPSATHIGAQQTFGDGTRKPYRSANEVWVEVEIPADFDYNEEALGNAPLIKDGKNKGKPNAQKAQILHIPEDGYYNYRTNTNANPNQLWHIAGAIKLVRILSDEEVESINRKMGVTQDLARIEPRVDSPDYVPSKAGKRTSTAQGRMRTRDEDEGLSIKDASKFNDLGAELLTAYAKSAKNPSFDDFMKLIANISQQKGKKVFDVIKQIAPTLWYHQCMRNRQFKVVMPDEADATINSIENLAFPPTKENDTIPTPTNESEDENERADNSTDTSGTNPIPGLAMGGGAIPGTGTVSSGEGNRTSGKSSNSRKSSSGGGSRGRSSRMAGGRNSLLSSGLDNEQSSSTRRDDSRGDNGRDSSSGNAPQEDRQSTGDGRGARVGDSVRDNETLPTRKSNDGSTTDQSQGDSVDSRGQQSAAESGSPSREASRSVKPENYIIPERDDGGIGKIKSAKNRAQANIRALQIIKQLEAENRYATEEEQRELSLYSGWGNLSQPFVKDNADFAEEYNALKELLNEKEYNAAMRSTQYAHYTPIQVIRGIYSALQFLGFQEKNAQVFEAGTGVGHFIGALPSELTDASYAGVEVDPISHKISQYLYPNSDLRLKGFEKHRVASTNDLVIGNPPFGSTSLYDPTSKNYNGMSMHNHFIAKQIDSLRPGGLGAFVVTHNFLDGRNPDTRQYINKKAEFLGYIRLPSSTFGEIANTDIVCDIVFFRKRLPNQKFDENATWIHSESTPLSTSKGDTVNIDINKYVLKIQGGLGFGKMGATIGQYGKPRLVVSGDALNSSDILEVARSVLPLNEYITRAQLAEMERNTPNNNNNVEDLVDGKPIPDNIRHPSLMAGGFYVDENGNVCISHEGADGNLRGKPCQVYDAAQEKANYEARWKRERPNERMKHFNRWRDVPNAHNKLSPKELEMVKCAVKLRDVRFDLVTLELSADASDEVIEAKRKELRDAYNKFREVSGGKFLNSNGAASIKVLMASDPAISQIQGLEVHFRASSKVLEQVPNPKRKSESDPETIEKNVTYPESAEMSDIFTKRVNFPVAELPTHYEDVGDALNVSINSFGGVNIEWMKSVTGKSEDEIMDSVKGRIFKDPVSGAYIPREVYLSGDVKTKLEEAMEYKENNSLDTSIDTNIEELKKVIPEDIPVADIYAPFGAQFVPEEVYKNFFYDAMGFVHHDDVEFSIDLRGNWAVKIEHTNPLNNEVYAKYPYPRGDLAKGIELALSNKTAIITKKVGDVQVVDVKATEEANQTIRKIREQWESWWQADMGASSEIAKVYNTIYNRTTEAKYDGSTLKLEGCQIPLHQHQKDAVLRTIMTRRVLFNHVVGAGKTLATVASIMEMRRMGIVRKPVIVVPNHMVTSWRDEFVKAYPSANVLTTSRDDFNAANRKVFFSRIQNGSYDAIIVPHSQLGKLSLSPDITESLMKEELDELRAALNEAKQNERKNRVTQIENSIQRLETKMNKKIAALKADNIGIYFDTLGIDAFVLDESHEFKNVPFVTSNKVAGLGDPKGSTKAFDLLMKTKYLHKYRPSAPMMFLTGTPVANSLTELYLNMKLVAPEILQRMGIRSMDSFIATFCDITTEYELDASGRMKERRRLRQLLNIGEVMTIVREYMDVVDSSDLNIRVPPMKGGKPINVVVKRSPEQDEYFGTVISRHEGEGGKIIEEWTPGSIADRATQIGHGGVNPKDDNMLKVTSDGRAASLDMRLIDPTAPDFANSKVNRAVDIIAENYKKYDNVKGTQLVFCDLSIPGRAKGAERKRLNEMIKERDRLKERAEKAELKGELLDDIFVEVDLGNNNSDDMAINDAIDYYDDAIKVAEHNLAFSHSVYDDVKAKLVAKGIPANEIAFIHSASNDNQKSRLFADVNSGRVRILLGSTPKMGAGTNVQERIVALHHLDTPWRPADMVQRNGRAIRQGNKLLDQIPDFGVSIYQYATEKTTDAFKYQTLESKGKAFETIYKADRNMRKQEEFGDGAMSAEEIKAAASGSKLQQKRIEVNKRFEKLDRESRLFYGRRNNLITSVEDFDTELEAAKRNIETLKKAKEIVGEKPDTKTSYYNGINVSILEDAELLWGAILASDLGKAVKEWQKYKSPADRRKNGVSSLYKSIHAVGITPSSRKLYDKSGMSIIPVVIEYRNLFWLPVWTKSGENIEFRAYNEKGSLTDYAEGRIPRVNTTSVMEFPYYESAFNEADEKEKDPYIIQRFDNIANGIDKGLQAREEAIADLEAKYNANKKQLDKMPETFPQADELYQLTIERADIIDAIVHGRETAEEARDYLSKYKYDGKKLPDYDWLKDEETREEQGEPLGRMRVRKNEEERNVTLQEYLKERRDARPLSTPRKIINGIKDFVKTRDGETKAQFVARRLNETLDWLKDGFVDFVTPIRDLQKYVAGTDIPEMFDIAKAAQLSFGRVHASHMAIEQKYIAPIREILSKHDIELEMLDTYLTAMYAPERNEMIRERTKYGKNIDEKGSGISDENAKSLINEIGNSLTREQFLALNVAAEMVWELNRNTVKELASAGIISTDTAEAWLEGSPHYVPLRDDLERLGLSEEAHANTLGKPFQSAVGRFSKTLDSQLAFSLLQAQVSVMLAEQNRIHQTALAFCVKYPAPLDKDGKPQWYVSRGPKRKKRLVTESKGFRIEDAIALDLNNPEDLLNANAFERENYTIKRDADNPDIVWVDPFEKDPTAKVRKGKDSRATHKPHNVLVRVDGHPMYIFFNDTAGTIGHRVGLAINKASLVEPKNKFFQGLKMLTHLKAQMVTRFNPTFVGRNMLIDANTAVSLLAAEGKIKDAGKFMKSYPSAIAATARWKRTGKFSNGTKADKYLEEAVYAGMLTGTYANATYSDNLINEIIRPLKRMQYQKGFGRNGVGFDLLAYSGQRMFELIGALSDIPEVGVRLATYIALRENGWTKSDAAVYAREITVDFNKKGRFSPVMNTLYMFFNAGIQSAYRWITAFKKGGAKFASRAIGGFMLLGFMSAWANDDDDDWKNITDWEKQKSIIIPLPGGHYIRIPNRGVQSIFTYTGMKLYDVLMGYDTTSSAFKDILLGPVSDTMTVLGEGAGNLAQAFSPTALDVWVQYASNTAYHGGTIYTERFPNQTTPNSHLGRKNTSEAAIWVAETLNALSGGDEIQSGSVDIHPETISHFVQFFFGGFGTEVAKVGDLAMGNFSIKNVPIVSGFVGEIPNVERRYYEAAADFSNSYDIYLKYKKSNQQAKAAEVFKENKILNASSSLYGFRRGVEKYRRLAKEAKKQGREDLVKIYEAKMLEYEDKFLKIYEKAKGFKSK